MCARVVCSAQEMFEIFEASLSELRLAKLAVHQVFFRTMEAYEAKCHDGLLAIAEGVLKQAMEDASAFDFLADDLSMVRVASVPSRGA